MTYYHFEAFVIRSEAMLVPILMIMSVYYFSDLIFRARKLDVRHNIRILYVRGVLSNERSTKCVSIPFIFLLCSIY